MAFGTPLGGFRGVILATLGAQEGQVGSNIASGTTFFQKTEICFSFEDFHYSGASGVPNTTTKMAQYRPRRPPRCYFVDVKKDRFFIVFWKHFW